MESYHLYPQNQEFVQKIKTHTKKELVDIKALEELKTQNGIENSQLLTQLQQRRKLSAIEELTILKFEQQLYEKMG